MIVDWTGWLFLPLEKFSHWTLKFLRFSNSWSWIFVCFTIYSFSRIFPVLLDVTLQIKFVEAGESFSRSLPKTSESVRIFSDAQMVRGIVGCTCFVLNRRYQKMFWYRKKAGQSFLQSPIIYGSFFNANFIISKTRRRLSMSNERSSQITKQRGAGNCLQLQSEGRVWEAAMGSHYKCPRWRRFRGKLPRLFTMWAKSENQKLKVVGTGTKTAIATAIHLRQYGNNLLSASQADCTVEFLLCYVFLVG